MKTFILMTAIFLATPIFAASGQSASGTAPAVSNAEAGSSHRKGQTDPTDKHSWIGSRARGQALQTDKFPRPPEPMVSSTATNSGTTRKKY